jgi:hypothetical protein
MQVHYLLLNHVCCHLGKVTANLQSSAVWTITVSQIWYLKTYIGVAKPFARLRRLRSYYHFRTSAPGPGLQVAHPYRSHHKRGSGNRLKAPSIRNHLNRDPFRQPARSATRVLTPANTIEAAALSMHLK